jgi:predicted regulator of Ras-like GTPase activity (Roadblock/LC7/MglB family)
LDGLT